MGQLLLVFRRVGEKRERIGIMAVHEDLCVALGTDVADSGIEGASPQAEERSEMTPRRSHGVEAIALVAGGDERPSVAEKRLRVELQALDIYLMHDVSPPAYMI